MNHKRAIVGPLLALAFLMVFAYALSGIQWTFENFSQSYSGLSVSASVSTAVNNIVDENTASAASPAEPETKFLYSSPEINSKAAISVESGLSGQDRVVFDKSAHERLPIASLTKLMTAVIVLDNYKLLETVTVSKNADSQEAMKQDIKEGQVFSVENLLDIMLIESSNKSAYALAEGPGGHFTEQKFVGMMNQKAKSLGLNDTYFADPTGLDSSNVSTASDLSKLAEHILQKYPKIASISRLKKLYVQGFGSVENTDQLLGEIPDVICSKTGFTTAANGCLLLVVDNPQNDKYLINVILGADDRFLEMKKLIEYSNLICK